MENYSFLGVISHPNREILGHCPVTSEIRSMTKKWPKCDFADNFASEQARGAIQRPEHSLLSLEYYAMPFGPLRITDHLRGQIKKNRKKSPFFFGVFYDPKPNNHFDTYEWHTDTKFKNSTPKYPSGHKTEK